MDTKIEFDNLAPNCLFNETANAEIEFNPEPDEKLK